MNTAGFVFHVMNRGSRKGRIFETTAEYQAFEALLVRALRRYRVELYSYSLMPNHWHFVLSPSVDGELSRFMHRLTTKHARRWRIGNQTVGQGAVYQGRFSAIPVAKDGHFIWVSRYVERNALRASLVSKAEEWRWSSLWQRQNNPHAQWLSPWPVCMPPDWLSLVNAPQTNGELLAFRQTLAKNQPFGDPEWSAATAKLMGLSKRERGRPKSCRK